MKRIVYIDDDLDDISVFQEAVDQINPSYIVESFSDSPAGVEFLEHGILKPDIIFLDINMPQLSGKQTLLLIRRMRELADVPVVMYSTTIHGEDKKVFLEIGANEFLKKATKFEDVVKEVNTLLTHYLQSGSKSIL